MTQLITDPAELPKVENLALVPTMGALHDGHLSLVQTAKERGYKVVVSIFVNPTQFGPGEDFDKYPRNLEVDLQLLDQVGADYVFAPATSVMYPGSGCVTIEPGPTASILEGQIRPTHFAGVLQVVAKLFNLVRPDSAVFGQKDAQQLALIRQMVRDLSYPIKIIAAPIVRAEDGLALSSRNAYLSAEERELALELSVALRIGASQSSPATQISAAAAHLDDAGLSPEYVEVVTWPDFEVVSDSPDAQSGPTCLLVAARVGSTRLIDNIVIGE